MHCEWSQWKSKNPAMFKSMKKACNEDNATQLMIRLKNIKPEWITDSTFAELFEIIMSTHHYACLEPLLSFAAAFHKISVSKVIRKYSLIECSLKKNSRCVQYVILKSTHLNKYFDTGHTPLGLASYMQNIGAVKLLLKLGVEITNELWATMFRYLLITTETNRAVTHSNNAMTRRHVAVYIDTEPKQLTMTKDLAIKPARLTMKKECIIMQLLLMAGGCIDAYIWHYSTPMMLNMSREEITKNTDKLTSFARNCY